MIFKYSSSVYLYIKGELTITFAHQKTKPTAGIGAFHAPLRKTTAV
jgi:hypothetical protein